MPNTNNRVLWGNGNGYLAEQLPNIVGYTEIWGAGIRNGTGVFRPQAGTANPVSQGGGGSKNLSFDASLSSSVYTNEGIVRPNSLQVQLCIKY